MFFTHNVGTITVFYLNVAINVDEKSLEIIQLRKALKTEKVLKEASESNNKELREQIEQHVAKIHQLELE